MQYKAKQKGRLLSQAIGVTRPALATVSRPQRSTPTQPSQPADYSGTATRTATRWPDPTYYHNPLSLGVSFVAAVVGIEPIHRPTLLNSLGLFRHFFRPDFRY